LQSGLRVEAGGDQATAEFEHRTLCAHGQAERGGDRGADDLGVDDAAGGANLPMGRQSSRREAVHARTSVVVVTIEGIAGPPLLRGGLRVMGFGISGIAGAHVRASPPPARFWPVRR
jgi:hypothetical protein